MTKFIVIIINLVFVFSCSLKANKLTNEIIPNKQVKYIIKLTNGDIISGYIVEMVSDPEEGDGIKFSTELGTATIYDDEIEVINPEINYYRHNSRVYLLPTAEPIKNNHFIGNFELLFFYVGIGISDFVSITAVRSLIPNIRSDQQFSVINTKFTVYEMQLNSLTKKLSFAVGGNLTFINSRNRFIHFYGVSTLTLNRSAITASLFYKSGSADIYDIRFANSTTGLIYPDGSFGIGLGLDTKFSNTHLLHFIGELWNSDVTKPTNTAVMLGLRLSNSKFSADFGLSFFTQPFVAPFMSFVWTPF